MWAMSSLDAEALDGVAIFVSVSVDVDFLAARGLSAGRPAAFGGASSAARAVVGTAASPCV